MSTARTEGNDYTKAEKENGNDFFLKNLANSKKTNKQKQIVRFFFFRQRDGEVPGIGIKVPWTRNFEKACPTTTTTIIIIIKTSKQTKTSSVILRFCGKVIAMLQ